jgi:hypothetical protein
MHTIDRKWTGLATGYQAIQSFKTKLAAEFGRAVRVGHERQFRKQLTGWQKKRRIFFALVAVAPLSIITLCLTAYYFHDVACVIIYWAVLVLIILVTLAVAGRQYIREMVDGRPVAWPAEGLVVDLEGRWWAGLFPQEITAKKAGRKGESDFLALLARSLPDLYSARLLSDSDLLLLGPSGIWILMVENWSGTVVKQDGIWKQILTVRDKFLRKQQEEQAHEPGPDGQWLLQKQEIVRTIEEHLPARLWVLNLFQGGVVFSHPKVLLDKEHIQGASASYGPSKSWAERILRAPAVDGFTLEMQLEILDALASDGSLPALSAKDEAERLYQQAVQELRAYVAKLVK